MEIAIIPWRYDDEHGGVVPMDVDQCEKRELDRAQFIELVMSYVQGDQIPFDRFELSIHQPQIKETWYSLVDISLCLGIISIVIDGGHRATHVYPLDGESLMITRFWLEREVMEF